MSMLLPNIVILILRHVNGFPINTRCWLITACQAIWALRLSIYIIARHKAEDYRYKAWREEWEAGGQCKYYTKAFLIVYLFQALFSLINNSTVMFTNIFSLGYEDYQSKNVDYSLQVWDYIGIVVWFMGLTIEALADM